MTTIARAPFIHDCTACTPLGQYGEFDLYYCQQGIGWPTVIARYGHEGSEYRSGLGFSDRCDELAEAKRRAEALGLNTRATDEIGNTVGAWEIKA